MKTIDVADTTYYLLQKKIEKYGYPDYDAVLRAIMNDSARYQEMLRKEHFRRSENK